MLPLLSGVYDSPRGSKFIQRRYPVWNEVFHALKVLSEKGLSTAVGDEGGFAPSIDRRY